ncbi:unnamed protein product [Mycetohabitans rhizoxinica HKI 454]|uniref:Uncharacterized protein n=1 Tax=Mycetohabitans rhizoxinica (strain DSM 19002 / CIP 109453 / HKI 454) TaxID=882378 RepID=E5ATD4_MYCRK|nr:unnamed protein product [Mycetohabitans rhizoxinica HKI 454]
MPLPVVFADRLAYCRRSATRPRFAHAIFRAVRRGAAASRALSAAFVTRDYVWLTQ